MRALVLLSLVLLLAGCPRPLPDPDGGGQAGFKLQQPFPCGTRIRVLCGYGCAPAHARKNDPQKTNEHFAVDFVREEGKNGVGKVVAAVAPGVVLRAGWASGGWAPYGIMVYIQHDYRDPRGRRFQSLYAHLGSSLVKKGARVDAGTPIGTLGGSSDGVLKRFGPHLHFAMFEDARPGLGGGRAYRPEPMGGYRNLRTGLRMVACVPPDPELVASTGSSRREP